LGRILLVRHGETAWNREGRLQGQRDLPLSATGRLQAVLVAAFLKYLPVEAIYTSPLERAASTAHMIGALVGAKPVLARELMEMDFGVWEGHKPQEIEAQQPGFLEMWQGRPYALAFPGGEAIEEFQARVVGCLDGIPHYQCAVVVTHGLAIRAALWWYGGLPPDRWRRTGVANGSITILAREGNRLTVAAENLVGHLRGFPGAAGLEVRPPCPEVSMRPGPP
jgi:probable phosphoglycerate mutase